MCIRDSNNTKPVTDKHCGYSPQLISLISTHIDDIKGGATDAERDLLLTTLKKHYGDDAKVETRNFEHTGIKHEQDPLTGHVYTHHDHY
eukprot:10570162-Prorocentrum_lima.AAC.1